jgi:hypothetical protein
VTFREWFGIVVLVIGAVGFPSLLLYGIARQQVLNIFGADLFRIALHRSANLPPPPLVVIRSQHPKEYWMVMSIYAIFSAIFAFIVFVYFYFPRAG